MIRAHVFKDDKRFFFGLSCNDSGKTQYFYDATNGNRIDENLLNSEKTEPLSFGIPIRLTEEGYVFVDKIVRGKQTIILEEPWIVIIEDKYYVLFESNNQWYNFLGEKITLEIKRHSRLYIPKVFRSKGEKQIIPYKEYNVKEKDTLTKILESYEELKQNYEELKDKYDRLSKPKEEILSHESLESILRLMICTTYQKQPERINSITYKGETIDVYNDISSIMNDLPIITVKDNKGIHIDNLIIEPLIQPLTMHMNNNSTLTIRSVIVIGRSGKKYLIPQMKKYSNELYLFYTK